MAAERIKPDDNQSEISRGQFIVIYESQTGAITNRIVELQLQLVHLTSIRERLERAEQQDLMVKYYIDEDTGKLSGMIMNKGPAGFILPEPEKEEPVDTRDGLTLTQKEEIAELQSAIHQVQNAGPNELTKEEKEAILGAMERRWNEIAGRKEDIED